MKVAKAREYLNPDQGYDSLAKKYSIAKGTVPSFTCWYQQRYPDSIPE
jgi:hypothetical protein